MNVNRRNIGVNFTDWNEAEAKIWAPLAKKVALVTNEGEFPLSKAEMGYWEDIGLKIKPGTRYSIKIDNHSPLPDPASLSQPDGVHAASEAINLQNFKWTDNNWKNIPLEEYIIYELHTGIFSSTHDFEGIINKLDHLIELGINAIEIMPVGQFPGTRNWGYDGVYPFAVQDSYGGAAGLQKLVNTCHEKGLSVILDVIYNHIGPEGNYLPEFGPYFTDKYKTPWGKALNFDDAWCNGARDYFIENVLMWFRDFHIDALRMDAVHAIKDFSAKHIIKEIKEYTNELMRTTGRNHYLIAEMDLNDPVFINPIDKGGYGVDGQWVDEFHHALRVTAGQPREGYYADFNGIEHLAKSYTNAYVYDGQFSEHRKRTFGAKTNNHGKQFVVFSQNHDQTGNRMLGERSSVLVSADMYKLMAAVVIISPYLPMLFMGEEWGETNPFLFFISHTDKELAALVNKGRKEEFSYFNWEGDPPDPRLEKTFNDSLLDWKKLQQKEHAELFNYYKKLIELRKNNPALKYPNRENTKVELSAEKKILIVYRWQENQHLTCIMNFSSEKQSLPIPSYGGVDASAGSTNSEIIRRGRGGLLFNSSNYYKESFIAPESILIYESI
jgi:maltooligosyltrehalose trehalohydrolase